MRRLTYDLPPEGTVHRTHISLTREDLVAANALIEHHGLSLQKIVRLSLQLALKNLEDEKSL